METTLHIKPNGPLLFRDTRPFNAGENARTQLSPHPSVTAGAIRTIIGKQLGYSFTKEEVEQVLNWSIDGPVLRLGGHNYFPAPCDAVLPPNRVSRLSPFELEEGEGMNLPAGLKPVGAKDIEGKPISDPPQFWRDEELYKWLCGENVECSEILTHGYSQEKGLRVHVTIGQHGTAKESHLFQSEGVHPQIVRDGELLEGGYLVHVSATDMTSFENKVWHRIGGEGGFARFSESPSDSWPSKPPSGLIEKVRTSRKIKLQLVTPALFDGGYLPKAFGNGNASDFVEWETVGASLRIVSVALPRWMPLAGWDINKGKSKPLKRLVPAGSVYFFEAESEADSEKILNNAWMKPVSDKDEDRKNGFGLALLGIWS